MYSLNFEKIEREREKEGWHIQITNCLIKCFLHGRDRVGLGLAAVCVEGALPPMKEGDEDGDV
jgi:hypothetical protein